MDEDKEVELTKQLEISNKEKETLTGQIETLQKAITDKDEKLKVFAQKEADLLKATRESQWQKIKNSIPKGLTHKPEDEAKVRTEFESDPYGFAVKLTEFQNTVDTPVEGVEFQNQSELDEVKKTEQAAQELREIGGMMRRRRV